ncbi:MAG: hypothetical protein MSG64_12975 [Pyrinomonadaceae bacterium MAG19_C2-C3]|nr:hypothetical protein [Pyrinomonadaceae bacterium MAG19_C2-C3]
MITNFKILFEILIGGEVEFIVIGGAAATAHGSARVTYDLDIVYRRTNENIKLLVDALAPHEPYLRGAPPGLPFKWSVETIRNGLNFTLVTTHGAIDLLGEVAGGGSYEDLYPAIVRKQFFGDELQCLNLEKLIATKRAAGRPKDFEVIAELESLREEQA